MAKKPAAPKAPRASKAPPSDDGIEKRRAVARETAIAIAFAALDKKAEGVGIYDISEKVDYTDFLVLATGRSDRQVVAIAQGIEDALRPKGVKPNSIEGRSEGHWVLLDFTDVVVHVFFEEARKYYDLEGLWMDAPRVAIPSNPPGSLPIPT